MEIKKTTVEIFDADGEDKESLVEDFGKLKLGSETSSKIIESVIKPDSVQYASTCLRSSIIKQCLFCAS